MSFLTKTENTNLAFTWKHKRPWISKAILTKKKCQKPDLKHGVVVTKMAWYCHKRHANQYKRQEGPGTNLPNASHLTFDKDIKN